MQIRKISLSLLVLALAASMSVSAFAATGYGPGTVEDITTTTTTTTTSSDDDDDRRNAESSSGGGSSNAYVPSTGTTGSSSASSGSGTTSTSSTPAPATTATVEAAVETALAEATSSTSSDSDAKVTLRNVTTVSANNLQDAIQQLADAGKDATVQLDRVEGNAVVSRVYVTAEIAAQLSGDVDFSVSVAEEDTAATKNLFETYFNNEVAVVSLGQQGAYGADIPMAVKVDLSNLNTETLVFYSYDKATGEYTAIPAENYQIDANGYLHFSTPVGGDIVITDKPLELK